LESILRLYLNKIGVLKSSLAVLFAGTIVFFRPILKEKNSISFIKKKPIAVWQPIKLEHLKNALLFKKRYIENKFKTKKNLKQVL
jgi:hypothetical protein